MTHLRHTTEPGLAQPTTAGSMVAAAGGSGAQAANTATNGIVSPCPRIPHLGTELTGLFAQAPPPGNAGHLPCTPAPQGRQANKAKRRTGLFQPPLHP